MTVFPIFTSQEKDLAYLSLKQAIAQRLLVITEISEGGSVPNLKVQNNADLPVLLLDGEEISGAKQNRILNTSILLKEKSEAIIPVSCTERGRWSYDQRHFSESGHVASASVRSSKLGDVACCLRSERSFRSDQGKVWQEIDKMSSRLEVRSGSDAMKDMYDASQDKLQDYLARFPRLESQTGMAVCFEDRVAGLDVLSRPEVWADLHEKLIRSYAVDCLGRTMKESTCQLEQVRAFLDKFSACTPQSFPSIGYGEDLRYESPELIGAGLVWQDSFIHLELYARFGQASQYDTRYHSPRHRFH